MVGMAQPNLGANAETTHWYNCVIAQISLFVPRLCRARAGCLQLQNWQYAPNLHSASSTMAVKLVAVTICVCAVIRAALAAGNSTQCQELAARGDCAFYQCLDSRLGGCGADGYPLGYGHRYCNRFHTTRNSFDARASHPRMCNLIILLVC